MYIEYTFFKPPPRVYSLYTLENNIHFPTAGVFIAPKVRRAEYNTILDPFQDKYGSKMGSLLFIPELFGDIFWEAAILGALGNNFINSIISLCERTCRAINSFQLPMNRLPRVRWVATLPSTTANQKIISRAY